MYSVSERVRRGRWSPTTESEAMTISPLPEDWSPVMGPEEVIVTDITINSLTVTFREAVVARGFFRSWELEIWHYIDWGWSKRGGENWYILFCIVDYVLAQLPPVFQTTFICTISSNWVKTFQNVVSVITINQSNSNRLCHLMAITDSMMKFWTFILFLTVLQWSLQIQLTGINFIRSGHAFAWNT